MLARVSKDPMLAQVPVLILLNKQDIESSLKMTTQEIGEGLLWDKWLKDRFFKVQEISAKTGSGLWESLNFIIDHWEEQRSTGTTGSMSSGAT